MNKQHLKTTIAHKAKRQQHSILNPLLWQRIAAGCTALVILLTLGMYGIARWYIASHHSEPMQVGATFIPRYARHFGLEPKEVMTAILEDMQLKNLRLVSYWDEYEKQPGVYDFKELDWQFTLAERYGAKVSLSIGLRQPRWPECHMPEWAKNLPKEQWSTQLKSYMGQVIDRYKNNPALESYQLENEFFLDVFGICPDHSRDRLVDEYNFVKSKDPYHPLIVSMSNNAIGSPIGEPVPDKYAISIYKRVWDKTVTRRYFEYPIPAWYYAFRAGFVQLTTGRDSFIHELQTEAWLPDSEKFMMNDISSIPEQNKSLNAERLKHRIEYGRATGMRKIDLWGIEWWYWRMKVANDPSLWQTAKSEVNRLQNL